MQQLAHRCIGGRLAEVDFHTRHRMTLLRAVGRAVVSVDPEQLLIGPDALLGEVVNFVRRGSPASQRPVQLVEHEPEVEEHGALFHSSIDLQGG